MRGLTEVEISGSFRFMVAPDRADAVAADLRAKLLEFAERHGLAPFDFDVQATTRRGW